MSIFWNIWIDVIVLGSIIGCWWLLYATRRSQTTDKETERTMGHAFDGIEEYDNPLPKWWFNMFLATIIFALVYLVLYPGLGSYKGLLGWTSAGQHAAEVAQAEEKYGPIYAAFTAKSVEELANDPEAIKMGRRLFVNNCAVCHGSAAKGGIGFPNLSDADWLYGGAGDIIKQSITYGRNGQMPAKGLKPDMTPTQINDTVQYLLSFSKRQTDDAAAARGSEMFQTACAACHGADAGGNQAMGAPNLTDNAWLYGGTEKAIAHTLQYGRAGVMPAFQNQLSEDKIHILSGYVYSLSKPQ